MSMATNDTKQLVAYAIARGLITRATPQPDPVERARRIRRKEYFRNYMRKYRAAQLPAACPEALQWRKSVLKRDHKFCRLCHARHDLETHHIKPFGTHKDDRWIVSNGITLCHDCHVQFRNKEMDYVDILSFIASIPVVVWRTHITPGFALA